MSLTIILGFVTLLTFFLLSKRGVAKAVLFLAFLLPLDNHIYFSWGFDRGTPARWAMLGILLYALPNLLVNKGLKGIFVEAKRYFVDNLKKDLFFFILLLLWLIRFVSFAVSLNLISSVSYQIFFTEVILIYLFIKHCVSLEGRGFILKFLGFYVLSGFLTSLVSPFQYYMYKFQDRILPGVWPLVDRPVRIGSLFWDVNHYGAYLSTIIPFIPYFIIKSVRFRARLFYIFAFITTLAAFGMTLSRSAFIGLGIGFAVFLILLSIKGYVKQAVIVLTAILVLAAGSVLVADRLGLRLSYQLQKRFLSIDYSYRVWDDSVNAHAALAYGSWQILEANPILGGGYGSFNEQFRKTSVSKIYFDLDPVKDAVIPPHSLWFEPLSAAGFLGGVPFFILFFLIFYLLSKRYKESSHVLETVLFISFITALVAVSFSGFFYSYNLEFFYAFVFISLMYGLYGFRGKLPLDKKKVVLLTLLITLAGSFIFYRLDSNTLIAWDESIYAKISKNILQNVGGYFNLVWERDKGVWFEKPPLYIWLTSFSYLFFGVNEFSARFVSALAGLASTIVVYFFGKRLWGTLGGVLSAVVLATTTHYIFQSRNGTMDVLMSLFILLSMFAFWKARLENSGWWLIGVFLGLGVMAKSAEVLVPVVALSAFVVVDILVFKTKYKVSSFLQTFGSFVLVGLPWHLVEYIKFGKEFVNSYLLYHIFERSKGVEGHNEGFWWYLVVIKVWFRHWALVLIPALVTILSLFLIKVGKKLGIVRFRSRFPEALFARSSALVYVLVWALVTFLIFSSSVSKIQWYIIPIYPALSLIVGWFMAFLFELLPFRRSKLVLCIFYVLSIAAVSSFLVYSWRDMWILEDYDRGLKDLGNMIAENRDRYEFIPRDVPVYIYDLPPGPPLFYIQRYAKVVGKTDMVDMFKSPPGKAFMAITTLSSYNSLQEHYKNSRVMIYAESHGYVLFGKDWKDVREQFNQQLYETPMEIYDPYYFCSWGSFEGLPYCN